MNSRGFQNKGFGWEFTRRWWNNYAQPLWISYMGAMGVIALFTNTENWIWILLIYLALLPFVVAALSVWLFVSINEVDRDIYQESEKHC
jgi:hypothetical protein